MKRNAAALALLLALTVHLTSGPDIASGQTPGGKQPATGTLSEIIARVENRYAVSDFSALFFQESTLKAMDITDTAEGRIYIKRPGKMRWEYTEPEIQVIISDGIQLWIFKPEDNQVMIGNAPALFGDGKGASFLSDIRQLRKRFDISLDGQDADGTPVLKLLPHDPDTDTDLSRILLSVDEDSGDIRAIVTINAYGDETRILLREPLFNPQLDDHLFRFEVPEGVEVIQMGQ